IGPVPLYTYGAPTGFSPKIMSIAETPTIGFVITTWLVSPVVGDVTTKKLATMAATLTPNAPFMKLTISFAVVAAGLIPATLIVLNVPSIPIWMNCATDKSTGWARLAVPVTVAET